MTQMTSTKHAVDKELLLAEMFRWRYNRQTYQGGPLDNSTLDRAIAFIDNTPPQTSKYPVDQPALDPLSRDMSTLLTESAEIVRESGRVKRLIEELRRKMAVRGTQL